MEVSKLSDQELIAVCRSRPFERFLDSIGCFVGPIAFLIFTILEGIKIGLCAMFAIPFSTQATAYLIRRLRCGRHQNELVKRHSVPYLKQRIQDAAKDVNSGTADSIFLFDGSVLPHGGRRCIKIALRGKIGRLEYRQCPFDFSRVTNVLAFHKAELDLDENSVQRLLEVIPMCMTNGLKDDLGWTVRDGYACNVAVISGNPVRSWNGHCNLAGLNDELRGEPTVRIALLLDELSGSVKQNMLMGSCDSEGNISVGNV